MKKRLFIIFLILIFVPLITYGVYSLFNSYNLSKTNTSNINSLQDLNDIANKNCDKVSIHEPKINNDKIQRIFNLLKTDITYNNKLNQFTSPNNTQYSILPIKTHEKNEEFCWLVTINQNNNDELVKVGYINSSGQPTIANIENRLLKINPLNP